MAEKYSFFDAEIGSSGEYDRTYSSEDLANYFASFVGNGVYANPATNLKVSPASGGVSVAEGKAWVSGYYYHLEGAPKNLEIEIGDALYPRIDRVVCTLNLSERLFELRVLKGDPAAAPKPVEHSRTHDVYDLVLAEIHIEPGMVDIPESAIKDTRPDNNLCGFVSGLIDQIETSELFSQYDDAFNTWFDSAKDALSGDVAGNLSIEIQEAQESINRLSGEMVEFKEEQEARIIPINKGGTGATTAVNALKALGITMGTAAAPSSGSPNTIYIQLL